MDIRPRLSPDGQRICFVSTRDGNYEIYVMDVDGGRVQRITRNEERDDFPSWHPSGLNWSTRVSAMEALISILLMSSSSRKSLQNELIATSYSRYITTFRGSISLGKA